MQNRQHTVSELQAILYKMDYYKLTNGFIGVCTKGGTPDFYESKPSFTMFSCEPVSREDVLKMIEEADTETHTSYKVLNAERTQGEWKVSDDAGRIIAGEKLVQLPVITNSEKAEAIANAKYTVLAVNNLHHLGQAFDDIINHKGDIEQGLHTYINELKEIAKKALNRIS